MNSRERIMAAINHKQADRIPIDIGSSMMTGIHQVAYNRWRRYLGLPEENSIRFFEPSMQIVYASEDFLDRLEIDTRPALPAWPASYPLDIHEDEQSLSYYDEWGYGLKMPKSDPIYYSLYHHPLNPISTLSEIKQYSFPNPTDPTRLVPIAKEIAWAEEKNKAIVLNNVCAGTMEVASWLRGLDQFLIDLALEPEIAEFLLDKVVEFKLAYWEMVLAEFGDRVDVVIESDDIGTQTSTLMSPRMYRKYIKPCHKKILDFIHSKTSAKVFFHSCGAIRPIIPDFIEIGVDIINPVQFNLAGMEPASLKKEFGRDIVFWGGGVETQSILGGGTTEQVRENVRQQIEVLADDGGFVFATVHNIQADVPPENLNAMWEAIMEFGKY
ncbi:MAG: uroporphyrinogen decarboxylase family protein [Anaerolineaceae bacterium]|nr:uroporphyrinogen decarboxylase family protein [Anaerolineaceae bacterium]